LASTPARPLDAGRLIFIILLALGIIFKLIENLGRPLQVDEALTLYLARLPLPELLERLRAVDVHPPLLFALLHALESIATPDWMLRLLMLAFAVGSLAMLYWIVRLWFDVTAARVATVCAAFMPSLLFYDSWIRMYALFHAEALLSFLLLTVLLTREDLPLTARRALWTGWALCTAAQWYTLYLGPIVTVSQLAFFVAMRRDGLIRAVIGAAAAFLLWLPQLSTFAAQMHRGGIAFGLFRGHEAIGIAEIPGVATIATQTNDVLTLLYGSLGTAGGAYIALVAVALFWLVATFVIALRFAPRTMLPWLGAPSLVLVAYSLASHKLLYADRYHLVLAYALAAWTGVAVSCALRSAPRLATAAAVVGFAALAALAVPYVALPAYSTAPWPAVATLLRHEERPGDLIVLDQGNPLWVLEQSGGLDGRPVFVVFSGARLAEKTAQLDAYRRIWYVSFQTGPVDPTGIVVRHLLAHWRLIAVSPFHDALPAERVDVLLFQR